MITKVVALTLLPMALVGGVAMNSSILVVDVNEGPGGNRIVVPVPLSLAQVALAFAPDEVKRLEIPEIDHFVPHMAAVIEELRTVPDAVFVEVEDHNDHVVVSKEGDLIKVRVRSGDDERVEVSVPLASVAALIDAYDVETGIVHTGRVVSALRAAPSGDLVHVRDGDEEVRVRMW